jgi:hypothetical protein
MKALQDIIKGITTEKELIKALKENGLKFRRAGERGDIWTGRTRIYKRHGEKFYTAQHITPFAKRG